MKTMIKLPLALTLAAVLCTTGCQQTSQQRSHAGGTSQQHSEHRPVATEPAPAAKPEPAPTPKIGCAETTSGLIHMTKTMPTEAHLGGEFAANLKITAQACAANVVVRDALPNNATYVRSEPPGVVEGNQLVWKIGNMDAGQTINAKIWFKADKEGKILNCASVSADPRVCGETFVGKATLTIDKTGPQTALLGADVTYNIVVKNTGNTVAHDVVVTDAVPEGMSHSGGQKELSFNVGDLNPGQSKPLSVTFKANKRGKICNTAIATSSNAGKVSDEACTVIQQPGLKIEKTTNDKRLLINRTATYNINVKNTGDTTLTGVVVTDTAANGTTIVEAVGGSVNGNVATWNVGELAAGASKDLTVKINSKQPGNLCNTAVVNTTQGLKDSSQACTEWIGVTGVLVEVVDDPDPIQIGESSTYTIRVTNQSSTGTVDELNIKAYFPSEITPTSASGSGTISGKNVTFPTVPTLAPKASVSYTIVGKAISAGDARLKVDVTTRSRSNPIEETESTTVY